MHQPSSNPQFFGGNWDHHLRMNSRKCSKNYIKLDYCHPIFGDATSDGLAGWKRTRRCLEPPWRLKPSRLEQEAWQLLLNLPKTGDNEFGIPRNASISDHVDTSPWIQLRGQYSSCSTFSVQRFFPQNRHSANAPPSSGRDGNMPHCKGSAVSTGPEVANRGFWATTTIQSHSNKTNSHNSDHFSAMLDWRVCAKVQAQQGRKDSMVFTCLAVTFCVAALLAFWGCKISLPLWTLMDLNGTTKLVLHVLPIWNYPTKSWGVWSSSPFPVWFCQGRYEHSLPEFKLSSTKWGTSNSIQMGWRDPIIYPRPKIAIEYRYTMIDLIRIYNIYIYNKYVFYI